MLTLLRPSQIMMAFRMLTISLVAAMVNPLVVLIMLIASSNHATTLAHVVTAIAALSFSMTLLTLVLVLVWWRAVSKSIQMTGQDNQTTIGGLV
jgi:hypothetical protein